METSSRIIKPILTVLGVGLIVFGAFVVMRVVWLGGAEIVIGALALLALSARPKSAAYAGTVLGIALVLLWLVAISRGVVGMLSGLTLAFAVAFIVGALLPRALPQRG
jgi:hypothetical protein